jgi:hypothetical protein
MKLLDLRSHLLRSWLHRRPTPPRAPGRSPAVRGQAKPQAEDGPTTIEEDSWPTRPAPDYEGYDY